MASASQSPSWLAEHGPQELELLFRAVVYHPSTPLLIADSEGQYRGASSGAGKLLGLSREELIGRNLDDFVEPSFKSEVPKFWRSLLQHGEQKGAIPLMGRDGHSHEVEYDAKANVMPVRHLLVLRDKLLADAKASDPGLSASHAAVLDFALFLLDGDGNVAAWYSGAERIYGYSRAEAIGQNEAFLYPSNDNVIGRTRNERNRAEAEGHRGDEVWCLRKNRTRFWANVITLALKSEDGQLQGFARVVRDFSGRHERDRTLRRSTDPLRFLPAETPVAGIVFGELDGMPEANDAFLELVGYHREDLTSGRLQLPDLTPPQYFALDEVAHEESLMFGASRPYEKELTGKDGTRVAVMVTTAVLRLAPFRWITFVQDLRARDRLEQIEEEPVESDTALTEIVGRGGAMRFVLGQVELVAPTDATVLILGETGTGKELIARAVHRISPRRDRAFITLNCAAIPAGLLESELFGYERGAFTGAMSQKIGRFELAHGGTLFLDEVGDIPLDLQPKLLRALQERSFERLGGVKTIPIDVRVVSATNRNLSRMMADKLFRTDLYYRLKVFPITVPPLRERAGDIPMLAWHFTQKFAKQMGRCIVKIPADTMRGLMSWSWPGNVRELENFIERAVILSRGPYLRAPLVAMSPDPPEPAGNRTLKQVEREHIIQVLRSSNGVISDAANRLGIPRTTLNALMRKLAISRKDI